MNATELYDAAFEAFKTMPQRRICQNADLGAVYNDISVTAASVGIKLTDREVKHIFWSERMQTIWDKVEYVIERHYAKQKMLVIWPSRGETLRVVAKGARA